MGLHDLGYKIFLDRYAQKDMSRDTIKAGDTVIVLIDESTGQREIGTIYDVDADEGLVHADLLDGTKVTRGIDHIDKPLETEPGQMMDRVARGVAAVEDGAEKQAEWTDEFRWLLDDWKFVPGGRILTAAGTDQDLTYYNCYVIPSPHDSRQGIAKTLETFLELHSRGGGVGVNLSSLRPRNALVRGVNGRSSGAVSWGALYSFSTGLIEQGGSRRGATMIILNDWHPDIVEFINSKRESGKITNANISVGLSDEFMDAVKNDGDWNLIFPDTSHPDYNTEWDGDLEEWMSKHGRDIQVYQTVKAREIWDAIIESAWSSAEPGIWLRGRAKKMSNSWYFNPLISTNPCGEEILPAWGVCNLGAINLSRFYDDHTQDVDYKTLRDAVQRAVRFLDNVIDTTPYHFTENAKIQLGERRIGLGTMGIAELMIRLGIRYGSDLSVRFIDKLYKFITVAAYETSVELSIEKGAFPEFNADKFIQSGFIKTLPQGLIDEIWKHGIRNVTLLTQAPTGTTGTMVNTSTGVEPYYSWEYYRKSRLGLHTEKVPIVEQWFKENPGETELPDYFVTAMDLAPQEHIKVQGAFQRWIDSAISKTCNVPNEYTVEQVGELYELMYELGCKGGTIYRDGSRDEQVLMLKEDEPDAPNYSPRPTRMEGTSVRTNTPFGKAYITINRDDGGNPFEVFIAIGKAGSDVQADAEGLGRMISLQLRRALSEHRLDVLKSIIHHLEGITGSTPVGLGKKRVLSLPDAVAKVLHSEFFGVNDQYTEEVIEEVGQLPGADTCPQCGVITLIRIEGCRKCLSCDYAEC